MSQFPTLTPKAKISAKFPILTNAQTDCSKVDSSIKEMNNLIASIESGTAFNFDGFASAFGVASNPQASAFGVASNPQARDNAEMINVIKEKIAEYQLFYSYNCNKSSNSKNIVIYVVGGLVLVLGIAFAIKKFKK